MSNNVLADVPQVPAPEMNTTPLIDVMLVLVVMLILTIPIMTDATKMTLPTAGEPKTSAPLQIASIDVDFLGAVRVDGREIALVEGDPVGRARAIDGALAGLDPDEVEVRVRGDAAAPYLPVVEVMAALNRGGFERVGFVGNERFVAGQ